MNKREAERSLEASEEIIAELKAHIEDLEAQVNDIIGPRRNEALDERAEGILLETHRSLTGAIDNFVRDMRRALDYEYEAGRAAVEAEEARV